MICKWGKNAVQAELFLMCVFVDQNKVYKHLFITCNLNKKYQSPKNVY